ncbi:MAG: hypothetical protein QQN46_07015 [Nitrosopumilus sp.]
MDIISLTRIEELKSTLHITTISNCNRYNCSNAMYSINSNSQISNFISTLFYNDGMLFRLEIIESSVPDSLTIRT